MYGGNNNNNNKNNDPDFLTSDDAQNADYNQDDTYEQTDELLQKQNLIIEHLKALEDDHYDKKLKNKKVIFETEKNFLDKFLIPLNNNEESSNNYNDNDNVAFLSKQRKKTTLAPIYIKKTTKSSFIFHGKHFKPLNINVQCFSF